MPFSTFFIFNGHERLGSEQCVMVMIIKNVTFTHLQQKRRQLGRKYERFERSTYMMKCSGFHPIRFLYSISNRITIK